MSVEFTIKLSPEDVANIQGDDDSSNNTQLSLENAGKAAVAAIKSLPYRIGPASTVATVAGGTPSNADVKATTTPIRIFVKTMTGKNFPL